MRRCLRYPYESLFSRIASVTYLGTPLQEAHQGSNMGEVVARTCRPHVTFWWYGSTQVPGKSNGGLASRRTAVISRPIIHLAWADWISGARKPGQLHFLPHRLPSRYLCSLCQYIMPINSWVFCNSFDGGCISFRSVQVSLG